MNHQLTATPRLETGERLLAVLGDQAPALARSLRRQTGERVLLFQLHSQRHGGSLDRLAGGRSPRGRLRPVGRLGDPGPRGHGPHHRRPGRTLRPYPHAGGRTAHPPGAPSHRPGRSRGPPERRSPNWILEMADRRVWSLPPGSANLDRVARRIARRTVGIALSSGSAHGLAHIGVLQVLEEAGIPDGHPH